MVEKQHTKVPYRLLLIGGIISVILNILGLISAITTRQLISSLQQYAGASAAQLEAIAAEIGLTADNLIQLMAIPDSFFIRLMIVSVLGIILSIALIVLSVKLKKNLQKNYAISSLIISILLLLGYGLIGAVFGLIGSIIALVKCKKVN